MGRKNKEYHKDLHQQLYDRLVGMQAFGDSKKEDMAYDRAHDTDIVSGKIYSFNSYQTYFKHCKYFVKWIQAEHPNCTTVKAARKYVNEWLQARVEQVNVNGEHLSAWTIQTEAAALNKLYHIKADDPERFQPPKRNREDIKRSRSDTRSDRHFSEKNNDELVKFCKGTGLRREGVSTVKGRDFLTRADISKEIARIESLPFSQRTGSDNTRLQICKDTYLFTDPAQKYFVYSKEKGGRERISPIIGKNAERIVERFRNTPPNERVWKYVSKNADIHSYRSDYCNTLYRMYARDIKDIPYDRINKGTGRKYQSDVYTCRKDEAGKKLDRRAMLVCSKALGHSRTEVMAKHYLRGI